MMRRLLIYAAAVAVVAIAVILPAPASAWPQVNDDFTAAEVIEGTHGGFWDANYKATKEVGEPAHAGNPGGASLWYSWTAPASTSIVFTAWYDWGLDPLLAVYTGSNVAELTEIASNDDWDGSEDGFSSRVVFDVVAGTEYRIAVDGYGGSTGWFGLEWAARPVNDDFASATAIGGPSGVVTGTNVGATDETGEPSHEYGSASVWYRWTAPTTGYMRFDTAGSNFDTVLAVYTGTAVDALTCLCANDDFMSLQSQVSFRAIAGTEYSIAVSGFGGETGDITLHWYRGAIITGTGHADVLHGTSGRDYIAGGGGNDILYGADGNDVIVGGSGADRLYGGRGADALNSRDNRRGNDVIYGGPGRDTARADRGDVIHGVP